MEAKATAFVREKETKNTIKYGEVPEEGQAPIIGALYVQKWIDPPNKLIVTVEAAD